MPDVYIHPSLCTKSIPDIVGYGLLKGAIEKPLLFNGGRIRRQIMFVKKMLSDARTVTLFCVHRYKLQRYLLISLIKQFF
jgi:hypothetical protein